MSEQGKKVTIAYTVKADNQIIDQTDETKPLSYIEGQNQIISGLETALKGLAAGDEKTVTVAPESAYGEHDPKAIVAIPNKNIQVENAQVGMMVSGKGPDGKPLNGKITALSDDKTTIDFNHPLAGQSLDFEVKVISVEDSAGA